MDSYSVHDAATVLGVPEARVWELIARGVLAGTPEADGGMRVFLKPSASVLEAPPPPAAGPAEAKRTNGNGNGGRGEGHGELSPFRELLTEFRNLTERYGQALLALGEARGEVAALRGRVDMLEARIDLRLPPARPTSTAAWEMPDYTAPPARQPAPPPPPQDADAVETVERAEQRGAPDLPEAPQPAMPDVAEALSNATAEAEPAVSGDEAVAAPAPSASRRAARRKEKIRSRRQTLEGIAEALARAEDPTLRALPGAQEAAEALAQLQRESPEAPVPAPEAKDGPMPEVTEAVLEPEELPEPVAAEAVSATVLVEPEAAELESEPGPTIDEAPVPVDIEPEPIIAEAPEAAELVEQPPEELPSEPSPYTTDVVEPDWFADGDFTWLEVAEQPTPADELPALPAEDAASEPAPDDPAEAMVAADPIDAEGMAEPADEPAAEPAVEPADVGPEADEPPSSVTVEPAPEQPAEAWWPSDERRDETARPDVGMDLPRTEAHDLGASRPSAIATATAEEELMWLGDEFEQADLEVATSGWRGQAEPSVQTEQASEPLAEPEEKPAVLELSDEELTRLARNEGWNMSEVDAIRTFLGRPADTDASEAAQEEPKPDPDPAVEVEPQQPPADEPEAPPPFTIDRPMATDETYLERIPWPGDPDWLRGRRGPAATAYRRLRRLFPD